MKKGSTVRVIDPQSAFRGMVGRICHLRNDPLPLGVCLRRRPGIIWFHEKELEWIAHEEGR